METQRQADSVETMTAQPLSHHALPGGIAGERLTNGVRCAGVSGMNRQPDTQITREEGLADLIWQRTSYVRLGVCDGGLCCIVRGVKG